MSIIKIIYNKIYISPFFYFLGLLCVLAGLFKAFIIMYLIVIVHELGHIVMALFFNYKIKKINIYPFGGYTMFDNDINTSLLSEFMVFIGGILFQMIFFMIMKYTLNNYSYIYKLINNYNTLILTFNMLPIIPLDGSKVLNIMLNKIFSFKVSHLISIYISYLIIIVFLIFNFKNLSTILMFVILLILLIKEHKSHKYIFNRFLLERYIKDIRFKNTNFIKKLNYFKMKKYCCNMFIHENKYLDEKEALQIKYNRYFT